MSIRIMMTDYKIVMSGKGIYFDNYGAPEPAIGFVACRIIRAESEELAIATARRNILVHWNQSFNADRKLGLPKLSIDAIKPVHRFFRRTPKHDYYFFVSTENRQQHVDKLTRKRPWWKLF